MHAAGPPPEIPRDLTDALNIDDSLYVARGSGARRGPSRGVGRVMRASLALLLVLALNSSPPVAAASEGTGGPLLPCGTSGGSDPGDDSVEVVKVFKFVAGVCAQRGETCPAGQILPSSCASVECQRAVQLAADSCGQAFARDSFLRTAFGPSLDAAVALCATAPHPADSQVRSRAQLRASFSHASPLTRSAPARCSATSSPVTIRRAAHSRCKLVTGAG